MHINIQIHIIRNLSSSLAVKILNDSRIDEEEQCMYTVRRNSCLFSFQIWKTDF